MVASKNEAGKGAGNKVSGTTPADSAVKAEAKPKPAESTPVSTAAPIAEKVVEKPTVSAPVAEVKSAEVKTPKAVAPQKAATKKAVAPKVKAVEKPVEQKIETPKVAPKIDMPKAATPKIEAAIATDKAPAEAVLGGSNFDQDAFAAPLTQMNKMREQMFKNYQEMVGFNQENVDAFVKSSSIVSSGVQELAKSFFSYAENSLKESVEASQALMSCKDVKEAGELQTKLVAGAYEKFVKEATSLSNSSSQIAGDAFAPLSDRLNVAFESLSKLNKAA